MKHTYEQNEIYSSSLVKICLAMLVLKKTPADFQEVIDFLGERQEQINAIMPCSGE